MTNDVELKFGAQTSEAEKGVEDLGKKVQESLNGMGESMSGAQVLAFGFGTVLGEVMMKAADQIGEMVQKAVMRFSQLGDSVEHMQRRLGGSAEHVSGLKIALESVGLSMGQFESIAQRLPQVLTRNGEKIKEAGIEFTNAKGEMLATEVVIQNLVTHLNGFSEGSARNTEGLRLMGREYRELADFVEMTTERTKEANDVADQFGLTLSKGNVEAANEFGRATRLLHTALDGFYVLIGKALTPALTGLANVMRDWLVPAYELFRTTLEVVMGVLEGFWLGVRILGAAFAALVAPLGLVVDLFGALWTGMTQGPAAGLAAVNSVVEGYKTKMSNLLGWVVDETGKTNERMKNLMDRPKVDRAAPAGGGADPTKQHGGDAIGKANADAALAILKEQLAEQLAALNADHKAQLVMTEQFYANKLRITLAGLAGEKEKLAADLAANAAEHVKGESKEKSNAIEAKAIALRSQSAVIDMKMKDAVISNEREKLDAVEKSITKRLEAEAVFAEKMGQIDLDMQRDVLAAQKEMGNITATEELQSLKLLEEAKHRLELETLTKKRALHNSWTEDFKKYNSQIELLAGTHAKSMQKINLGIVTEQQKDMKKAFDGVKNGFQGAVSGLLQGTLTFKKALLTIWQSINQAFSDFVAKQITDWVFGETTKAAISRMFSAIRIALFGPEAAAATVAAKAEAFGVIPAKAAEAAGGAASAVAGIPIVGPAMAATAYASTMAMVMSGMAVASASQGFDIPAGLNPLTQLHQKEMVLPAEQADVIRGMAGGGGGGNTNHYTIYAMDGADVKRVLMNNHQHVASAIRRSVRNFTPGKA